MNDRKEELELLNRATPRVVEVVGGFKLPPTIPVFVLEIDFRVNL